MPDNLSWSSDWHDLWCKEKTLSAIHSRKALLANQHYSASQSTVSMHVFMLNNLLHFVFVSRKISSRTPESAIQKHRAQDRQLSKSDAWPQYYIYTYK